MFKEQTITLLFIILFSLTTPSLAQTMESGEIQLVDPTLPLNYSSKQSISVVSSQSNIPSLYKLSSILIRPNLKIAVINSQRLSIGDSIGNAKVIDINKETVDLSIAGENRIVTVYKQSKIKTLVNESHDLVVVNP